MNPFSVPWAAASNVYLDNPVRLHFTCCSTCSMVSVVCDAHDDLGHKCVLLTGY